MPLNPIQGTSLGTRKQSMKYELVPATHGLLRIKALKDIEGTSVKAGDIGGFVSATRNLSQLGSCWIYDDASATGDAIVTHGASMHGKARVSGSALLQSSARMYDESVALGWAFIGGNATLSGHALARGASVVTGDSSVSGNSIVDGAAVFGNARVSDCSFFPGCSVGDGAVINRTEDVFVAYPVGSESGVLTVYKTASGLSVTRGCYNNTVEAFLLRSASVHDADTMEEYELLIEVAKRRILKQYPKYRLV